MLGCKDDDTDFPVDSLAAYIQSSGLQIQRDSLIACAISTKSSGDPQFPIEVIYYPLDEISDIRYYESRTGLNDVGDFSLLTRRTLQSEPMFNGYLQKFLHPGNESKVLGVVTYKRNNKLFISDGIHVQTTANPTNYNDDLLTINQTTPLSPFFSWQGDQNGDNIIYFQVVADESNNLISGTYTIEKEFQFYNLDNVVLNIRDIEPIPSLLPGNNYTFWLFGVNAENWVNLIAEKSFKAE